MFFTKENDLFRYDLNKKKIQKQVKVADCSVALKIFKNELILFTNK